ncbi:MAG: insulinase family protein [Candidatus Ventricola sp.]
MKKWLAVLLIATLALFAQSAAAQETLASGDELCGFTVTQVVHNEQYDLDFVHMQHQKTGALLVYIPCEDTERSFTVSFRTPAENDKGIPHVYEHSTLGGSEKYPDPSLFFSMVNQTYNTWLNAATYISNTTFDVASLSEEQLLAFADYVVNGLYHPTIMTDERTMMREAYRYELTSEDAPLTLTGTVYSEMQAHTSPLVLSQVRAMKMEYPGSRFAAFNGGDPDVIPEMTWQELKDFHDKYYHPSNSLTVLYGKLDPEPFLQLIDAEISRYDRQEIALTDDGYTPISGYVEVKETIPVSADSPKEAYIYYAIPLSGATEHEMDVLHLYSSMYITDGSPMYELFARELPEATVYLSLDMDPDPMLCFYVLGAQEEQADRVRALLEEGIALTAEQGVDGEMMKAAATATRLQMIQARENNHKGVDIAAEIVVAWGPQGDEFAYVANDRRKADVAALADAEALRSLAETCLKDPETCAYGVYVTAPGELEKKNAAQEARLAQMKADMTDEERAALIARTKDFAEWTEANAASSMIDAVKVVDAQSLPEEIVRYEAEETVQDGVRVIRADVDSDELVSVQLVFTADNVPYEQYDAFDAYIQLIGSIDTQHYTTDALTTAVLAVSTGMSIERDTLMTQDGGFRPVVKVGWDCLPENLDACFDLARELLFSADTKDVTNARLALTTTSQMVSLYMAMDPSMMLTIMLPGYTSDAGRFDALPCMGDRFTQSMEMGSWSDEALGALLESGQALLEDAMRVENLTVCSVGSRENNDKAIAAGLALAGELSAEPGVHYDYAALMEELPQSIAFPMDIDVGYNAMAVSFAGSPYQNTGKLQVFTQMVENKVLVPELRFKNASYGAALQAGRTGMLVYSYRDPKLEETYALCHQLGDMVRNLELTQEDVNGFIVSVFSGLSMPMGPMTGGAKAVDDKLNGRDSFADKLRYMREAKQTTVEDIHALADILDWMDAHGARISVHSQRLIQQSSGMFDVTDDCLMFSTGDMGDWAEEDAQGEAPGEEPAGEQPAA